MNSLETIAGMRHTLAEMNACITPYSEKRVHQNYLESLKHYKKILSAYISRLITETDEAIEKTNSNIEKFSKVDNDIIRQQVVNGHA
jgi:GTPase SAR1 family protein